MKLLNIDEEFSAFVIGMSGFALWFYVWMVLIKT